jgi:hypothetical protein
MHDFFIPTGGGGAGGELPRHVIVDPELIDTIEDELVEQQARDDQRRAAMTSVEREAEDTLNDEIEAQLCAALTTIQPSLVRRGLMWPSQLRRVITTADDDYAAATNALDVLNRIGEMLDWVGSDGGAVPDEG